VNELLDNSLNEIEDREERISTSKQQCDAIKPRGGCGRKEGNPVRIQIPRITDK
jgi:hypothetical protein